MIYETGFSFLCARRVFSYSTYFCAWNLIMTSFCSIHLSRAGVIPSDTSKKLKSLFNATRQTNVSNPCLALNVIYAKAHRNTCACVAINRFVQPTRGLSFGGPSAFIARSNPRPKVAKGITQVQGARSCGNLPFLSRS